MDLKSTKDAATTERMARLTEIMRQAREVFGNEEAAQTWLRAPNLAFRNTAPIEYLSTEPGALAVRQVLNAIATGGVL